MNQRYERASQIADLIKEYFYEVAPTTDEIAKVEEELRNDPQMAIAELCVTTTPATSVNMLYMSSAVAALRKRKYND
jgi:hypothetical protein